MSSSILLSIAFDPLIMMTAGNIPCTFAELMDFMR